MNNAELFLNFLQDLKTKDNKPLIEAVAEGFNVIRSLYESPDKIFLPKRSKPLFFRDSDAYAFIYLDEKDTLYLSAPGISHGVMMLDIVKNAQLEQPKKEFWTLKGELGFGYDDDDDSNDSGYHGRLWLKAKVISFWKYPSEAMFQTILSKLKEQGVPIDETWRVEVYLPPEQAKLDLDRTLILVGEYVGQYATAKNSITQEELDMLRELHTKNSH